MDIENAFIELTYPLFEYALWCQQDVTDKNTQGTVNREHIVARFVQYERNAMALGLSVDDVQDVKYALTAFIDETLKKVIRDSSNQSNNQPINHYQPLQLEFFGEHTAGEGFFNKLNLLRQNANTNVLEIYFLCLQLGFEGDFAFIGKEKLTALKLELRSQLDGLKKNNGQQLSVNVFPKEGIFNRVSKSIPLWIFASVATAAFLIVFFGFSLTMDSQARKSIEQIRNYVASSKNPAYKSAG